MNSRTSRILGGRPYDNWDTVKLIALLLMTLDHLGGYILREPEYQYWLRAIGRGAAPIFLFLTGYAASYRIRWDLPALAFALTAFEAWLRGQMPLLNILYLIIIARVIFDYVETRGTPIRRPWEWVVGALVLIISDRFIPYGSIGFLFALCGYMHKHADHYTPTHRAYIWAAALTIYVGLELYVFYPPISLLITLLTMAGVTLLLWNIALWDLSLPRLPAPIKKAAKFAAFYSGYIYVIQLMIFKWVLYG